MLPYINMREYYRELPMRAAYRLSLPWYITTLTNNNENN